MVSITTSTPMTNGKLLIKKYKLNAQVKNGTARISKVKTLDGGVSVSHNGFTDGDRKIDISAMLSKSNADTLWDMFTGQTFVTVAIDDGVYNAVIKTVNIKDTVKIIIEFESKLSE